jgi:two-component system response regulator YesN
MKTNFLHKITNNTFLRIFLFMSIPIFICIIIFLLNNAYYFNQYKEILISNYTNELNTFSRNTEKELDSISKNARFLTYDKSFQQVFLSLEKPTSQNLDTTTAAISSLKDFVASSSIIDSAVLVNRSGEFVLTNTGLYEFSEYFDNVFCYQNYSADYWKNYREPLFSTQSLPPTPASLSNSNKDETEKNVIPIVFSSLPDLKTQNLFIVNINITSVFEELLIYQFTPNTSAYMLNKFTLEFFSKDSSKTFPLSNDTSLISEITADKNEIKDDIKINGKKNILLSSSNNNSVWGYSYIITIPHSDINTNARSIYTTLIFALIILIAVFLITYYGSKKIYHPIEGLASMVGIKTAASGNENSDLIVSIQNSITNILHSNEKLRENLSVFLPLSQEKYLIDIINGNETNSTETKEKFEKLAFKHRYYISIVVHLVISSMFTKQADYISPQNLQQELYNAIQSIFLQYFDTYVLPSTGNVLYLLLNVEDDKCIEKINELVKTAENLFIEDRDYIEISFALGNIYPGIEGLKRSHNEAIINLSKLSSAKRLQISPEPKDEYSFDLNSENILINYLIAGYADKAKSFLEEILSNVSSMSPIARNQLYTDIANTLFKVMHIKKIPYLSAVSGSDAELIINLLSKSNNEISQFFTDTIDKISQSSETAVTKINITEVIDYINAHFTEDLYLESLAQHFNTTPKYISKRIKQHLNISFKDYLAQLRTDYAKELLANSDMKISEISEKCGFYNRSTFVRTFKQKSGLTPTEYRTLHTKGK